MADSEQPPVPATAAAGMEEPPLPRGVIWAYCMPSIGFSFMGMLFGIYLMKFSTDVLLIAPAAIAVLFAIGRAWDAISDPVAGYLSDRSTARRGRRRSWMFASAIPLGVATLILWSPPPTLSGWTLLLWMGFALILYETAMTVFFVPYGALGVELTKLYHERTRLFAYRHVISAAGSGLGLGGVYLLRTSEEPRVTAFAIALIGGVILSAMVVTIGPGWYSLTSPSTRNSLNFSSIR
ncbi:MAG: MFS transporter, partial [Myxococcota bacterium]